LQASLDQHVEINNPVLDRAQNTGIDRFEDFRPGPAANIGS